MLGKIQKRIAVIAFFIGLNLALGAYFLTEAKIGIPVPVAQILSRWGVLPQQASSSLEEVVTPRQPLPDLSSPGVIEAINAYRSSRGLAPLATDAKLTAAAEELMALSEKAGYDRGADFEPGALEAALKKSGYTYEWVSHNALTGPVTINSFMTSLLQNREQTETVENEKFEDIGVAASIVTTPEHGELGVVIQLLGKKAAESGSRGRITNQSEVREIPDQEVVDALNAYRDTHGFRALAVNDHLCTYAEKRAADLKAYGGLDGHEGFKKDFEDPDNLPPGIEEYPREGKFAENLAHQFCKNMQTGESFVAQNGTSLIEWCFDSSTKGHREAQLSPDFRNVCVRHADNMYVVIFAE